MRLGKLLRVIVKSESIHYSRIWKLLWKIDSWSGRVVAWPIIAILVTVFHYLFSGMHTLFEITLMVFKPQQFDNNMIALEKKYSKVK